MKSILNLFLILLLSILSYQNVYPETIDSLVFAKKIKLNSTVLGEERIIFISTPANYDQTNLSYPVMYILDGSESSILFTSGLIRDLSTRALCPDMIIVAISNTDRFRDMTPTLYKRNPKIASGGANKFLEFIETELFSFVEENYRTVPYRLFKGHSASGICVTHAFLSHNHMFNAYIGISPSLWWDSNLASKTADKELAKMNLKFRHFYFSTGSKETKHNIEGGQSFFNVLKKINPSDLKWKYDHIQNEDHGSQSTIAMYNALRFIYADWKYSREKLGTIGLSYIDDFFKKQSALYGYEISPSETELNSIGYVLLRRKKYTDAIEVFERNIHRNPESANAYDSLGDVYYALKNYPLSIKNYEKAVLLGTEQNDPTLDVYRKNLTKAKNQNSQTINK